MTKPKNGASRSAKTQTEIPGTEHPDDVPELDAAVVDWLSALAAAKRARKKAHEKEAVLLLKLKENNVKSYVYRDGTYKHTVKSDRTARLKHKQESEAREQKSKSKARSADAPTPEASA